MIMMIIIIIIVIKNIKHEIVCNIRTTLCRNVGLKWSR